MEMREFTLVTVLSMIACSGSGGTTSDGGTTTSAGEVTSDASSESSSSSGAGETDSGATTAVSPGCGDGILDGDEECDDGNAVNGDGCNSDCVASGRALWEHREDRGGTDIAYGVAARGEAAVAVGVVATGDQGRNGWLAGIDAESGVVWQRDHDLGGSETLLAVALASDGQIWGVGAADVGDRDLWIARFSAEGEAVGGETLGSGLGDDYAGSVVIDAAGRVTVAGVVANGVGADIWVRRYTGGGASEWTTTVDPDLKGFFPFSPQVVAQADGGAVVGFRERAADNTGPELLFALPASGGAPSWKVQVPGSDGTIQGLARAANGDLVAAVGTLVDGALKLGVRRLSAEGAALWSSFACSGENGRGVAVDPQDGSVVVIGDGAGGGGTNIRLCKLSADGALLWGKDLDGGAGDDLGRGVTITPSGRIIAVGEVAAAGGRDAWIAAFAP